MPVFDDRERAQAPPEEVWKLLYDPSRFPQWWAGVETVVRTADSGEYTMYPSGYPDFPMPQVMRVSGSAVTISCLVSDLIFQWRLEPVGDGSETEISVHVEIPDAEAPRLAAQREVIRESLGRLAALAATCDLLSSNCAYRVRRDRGRVDARRQSR